MARDGKLVKTIDIPLLMMYLALVFLGWATIYASELDINADIPAYDFSISSGRQLVFIATSSILIVLIMATDYKFYDIFSYFIYGAIMLVLVAVLGVGKTVAGSKSWLGVGSFGIQPSEFAKFAVALALSKYLSNPLIRLDRRSDLIRTAGFIFLPALLILLQNDTGSTLVFSAFIIPLYREGLPSWIPALGIGVVFLFILTLIVPQTWLLVAIGVLALALFFLMEKRLNNIIGLVGSTLVICGVVVGANFFINDVLQPHQQNRIKVLVNPTIDPLGVGWNVTQSKNAIGSGGFFGKGYLQGTQTKFDFVPEQSTDFIFCTIGEEFGWLGSLVVCGLFLGMLWRLIFLADRQKLKFSRVYGYCVAAILFFHFTINIGMTVGLLPVIGIPLPFISYGGSSLWSFTVLLFIFLKLDAHRGQMLARDS
ncbi:MAG TPA: rod shape-determining protein RodA [Catalimonadaceae bacterium]|jgi:rod shape determining protein RodA|nr:rod shape-determining protein RodA [Catalimonadaceae bacterium]